MAIEGHTDSRPFLSPKGNYGNWELSTERANAARRVLEMAGVERIAEVRGLADTHLRITGNPLDHGNRRVALIVRYISPKPGGESAEPAPQPAGLAAAHSFASRSR